jgi:hypothetical protein
LQTTAHKHAVVTKPSFEPTQTSARKRSVPAISSLPTSRSLWRPVACDVWFRVAAVIIFNCRVQRCKRRDPKDDLADIIAINPIGLCGHGGCKGK